MLWCFINEKDSDEMLGGVVAENHRVRDDVFAKYNEHIITMKEIPAHLLDFITASVGNRLNTLLSLEETAAIAQCAAVLDILICSKEK